MSGDTVFAPATAPGRGGVGVIRISGPSAFEHAAKVCRVPAAGTFHLAKIRWNGLVLDEALILSFGHGASFTGEETVEFHCHGSIAVIKAVCDALRAIGLRDAEAGEFTRRALENGNLSLVEVEALADLIDAETSQQHRQAMMAFGGELRDTIEQWRADLDRSIALVEATIDFADEDVPVDVYPEVNTLLSSAEKTMTQVLRRSDGAERIRSGSRIAIIGHPNSGKSTLMNRISGSDIAITSDIPGTTRDVLTVRVDLDGMLVEFGDTAGIRQTTDIIEKIGVERAIKYASEADLRIFLEDEDGIASPDLYQEGDIRIWSKGDINGHSNAVSGTTGMGVDCLLKQISDRLKISMIDDVVLIRDRQRVGLKQCIFHIYQSLDLIAQGVHGAELIVDEIYQGRRSLDFILGRLDVESVLDQIFSSFCIGK